MALSLDLLAIRYVCKIFAALRYHKLLEIKTMCGGYMKPNSGSDGEPLDILQLEEIVNSGQPLDLVLCYQDGAYYIWARSFLGSLAINHPIFAQRKTHRKFKDLSRALDWGKREGFRSAELIVDYADYP